MLNTHVPAAATNLPEDDAIMQLAERHGLRTPRFSREGAPEAWQCWADRVLNLNTCRPERLAEMIRDADRAAGYAPSPPPIATVEQHFLRNLALRDRALAIAQTVEAELTAINEAMDIEADDADLEDGGDDEPSLGACERFAGGTAWTLCGNRDDLEMSLGAPEQVNQHLSHGRRLGNREDLEYEGDTVPECDREPSLGSTGSTSGHADQALWALASMLTDDEDEHDGTEPEIDEPSLGATEAIDQDEAWAATSEIGSDLEAQGTADDLRIPGGSIEGQEVDRQVVREMRQAFSELLRSRGDVSGARRVDAADLRGRLW